MWFRCAAFLSLCFGLPVLGLAADAPELASALSTRYAPYANWQAVLDVDVLARQPASRYWKTPEEVISQRVDGDLPLAGLHLALDPGHVGGQWAADEGRHFRISEGDFYVREGELVLEVAKRVRSQLEALGAEITLLREANIRVNPKHPIEYLELAATQVSAPKEMSLDAYRVYGRALRDRAVRLSIVTGDLAERARLVNEEIQPDALISLHVNAAAWPTAARPSMEQTQSSGSEGGACGHPVVPARQLVTTNNLHALIFGCMSAQELSSARAQEQLVVKLSNGSGEPERLLGNALVSALAAATDLPAATYEGRNAILLSSEQPYLYARNLLLLRMSECPTVLLEPYMANSVPVYERIQSALANRSAGLELAEDDILVEYANAVVAGVLACYGEH